MLENIAMWGGVAGIIVSLFAIIIIFLTRKNILDILDKDVILFDKNFELKNKAIQRAFRLVDDLDKNNALIYNPDYVETAKSCYNELLCVVSDAKVADEFYNITIDNGTPITKMQIAQFKLNCRRDIGLTTKHSKLIKRIDTSNSVNSQLPTQNTPVTPTQPRPTQQRVAQPRPMARPAQPTTRTKPNNEDDKI